MTQQPLAVPLTQAQVDAANRLYRQLSQWASIDSALETLAKALPEWTFEASLLKVAAINQLYGTNLYMPIPIAKHVVDVMRAASPEQEGIYLVERLAVPPLLPDQNRQMRYHSFASKLAHFFIDSRLFPMYDSFVNKMLRYHLGRLGYIDEPVYRYRGFVANLTHLQEASGVSVQGRELDRYLWLAGEYRAWRKNASAPINREVLMLFSHPSTPQTQDDLHALLTV